MAQSKEPFARAPSNLSFSNERFVFLVKASVCMLLIYFNFLNHMYLLQYFCPNNETRVCFCFVLLLFSQIFNNKKFR